MDGDTIPLPDPFLIEPPPLKDDLISPTSKLQDATLSECLPLLRGLNGALASPFDYDARGIKYLDRESHVAFLKENLAPFPAPFVSIDASRPWMIYWALAAFHFLGQDVTAYRHRVIKTFYPLQNKSGGYGGGQGHSSHLAGTYATILSLGLVGGTEAYELTNREAMWSWLGRLKQADGGFQICEGGEEDTRAAYCALLVIALLDLPWELPADAPARQHGYRTFGDGLGEYISRCQTYEGGIASAPGGEAHGAYAFCALAALCLLDAPHVSLARYLNLDACVAWLSSRQYAPEGGLAGRTNKVVDGCYSHWIGGCYPLVQAALTGPIESVQDKDVGNLYSSEGLARYILNCCQSPDGGLRDKPSKRADSYHTCYTLRGLSAGEYFDYYVTPTSVSPGMLEPIERPFDWVFTWNTVRNRLRMHDLTPLGKANWRGCRRVHDTDSVTGSPGFISGYTFDAGCESNAVHPVFVIPHKAVLEMRAWACDQARLSATHEQIGTD